MYDKGGFLVNCRSVRLKRLFTLALTIVFLLGAAGCVSQASALTNEAGDPQPGWWEAEFSIELTNGKMEHWMVYFMVTDDGKEISSVEMVHYIGELTSSTYPTALFTVLDSPIENDSFAFSLTELAGYSTYTYKGNVTFISSEEADVILNVYDVDYQFTAVPEAE